jgi:hypothetical protein
VIAGEVRVYIATIFISTHHMEPSLAVKQTVGNQRVQVRMEVEIFAEGMDRHHDGWNAIALTVTNAVRVAERITQKVWTVLCSPGVGMLSLLSET